MLGLRAYAIPIYREPTQPFIMNRIVDRLVQLCLYAFRTGLTNYQRALIRNIICIPVTCKDVYKDPPVVGVT